MATEYPMTEAQVRFYEENGYIQLLGVLAPEELAPVRTALDEVMAMPLDRQHDLSRGRPEYERICVQKVNLWQVHPGMRQYVLSPKLAEIARRLARATGIRLWHDHALVKMPGDSKPSAWHQDCPTGRCRKAARSPAGWPWTTSQKPTGAWPSSRARTGSAAWSRSG